MATVINDLVTRFGFDGSIQPLHEYNAGLGGSVKLLAASTAALTVATGAFFAWSDSILTGVNSLDALSKQTGVAVSTIQELSFAASQSQSSAAAMESTISGLNSAIGSAAREGSADFARLGISVRDAFGNVKTADTILDEVRQRFGQLNLSMQEQESIASSLGIDQSLIQLLNKSNTEMAGLRDRARELGVLTNEQTAHADAYKKSLDQMWFGLNAVKQSVAIGVAPQMTMLADTFTDLLVANKDWIVGGIQSAVEWVGVFFDTLRRLWPVIAGGIALFGAWQIATLGLSGAFGVLLSPVVVVTAAIIGVLAIIDDLIVAFQGGKSVIADFFQEAFGIDIVPIMQGVVDAVGNMVNGAIAYLQSLWDWIGSMGNDINALFESIGSFFGFGGGAPEMMAVPEMAGAPEMAGVAAQQNIPIAQSVASNSRVDNRQVNQDVSITVTAPDPVAAGTAISNGLDKQLANAKRQLDVGGF